MMELPERPLPPRSVAESLRVWIQWFGVPRLIVTVAAVVVIGGGGYWLVRSPVPSVDVALPHTQSTAGTSSSPTLPPPMAEATSVVVHVAGAVRTPGVYEIDASSRVIDAIDAAGGSTAEGRLDAMNLAAPLNDGLRIYVPVEGEEAPQPAIDPDQNTMATGPVDLNTASEAQLDALPGVGPATAAAIIRHREQAGPFATVDDLERVAGIGPAKLAAIREFVTV